MYLIQKWKNRDYYTVVSGVVYFPRLKEPRCVHKHTQHTHTPPPPPTHTHTHPSTRCANTGATGHTVPTIYTVLRYQHCHGIYYIHCKSEAGLIILKLEDTSQPI